MVFISLEGVVGHSAAVNGNMKSVESGGELPIRVVVTPGSPAKQNLPAARAGLFHLASTQRTLSSTEFFVLYVSDSVMRHKWVLSKTSADQAKLRKRIQRLAKCKDSTCHLHHVIKMPSLSTRRIWGSTSTRTQYDQCQEFQEFLNGLVEAALIHDNQCESLQQTRQVLEGFLDIAHHRANAIDRVLYNENAAVVASPTTEEHMETPLEPNQGCRDASDDSSECPICCGDLADDQTLRLRCGHNFHGGCVRVWLNLQNTCPVCRLQLGKLC